MYVTYIASTAYTAHIQTFTCHFIWKVPDELSFGDCLISDSTLSMAVHFVSVPLSLPHSLPTGASMKEGEGREERGKERGGGARRRVGGVRWKGGSEGGEGRGGIDGDIGTSDTDYCTEHQTQPTTPHPTLTIIPHHLCVVIPLVSIILLVCWLWLYV